MIGWMEEMLGKKAAIDHKPFNKADVKETWADIEKASRLLGWKPQIDVKTGFRQTIDWYMQNKDWAKNLNI